MTFKEFLEHNGLEAPDLLPYYGDAEMRVGGKVVESVRLWVKSAPPQYINIEWTEPPMEN